MSTLIVFILIIAIVYGVGTFAKPSIGPSNIDFLRCQMEIEIESNRMMAELHNELWKIEQDYIDSSYESEKEFALQGMYMAQYSMMLPEVESMDEFAKLDYIPSYCLYLAQYKLKEVKASICDKPLFFEMWLSHEICPFKWHGYSMPFKKINTKMQYA